MNVRGAVEDALYAALNVSAVTTLATGGVYNTRAGSAATPPYVVFNLQAETDEYTMPGNRRRVQYVYQVKAVTRATWPKSAAAIDAACDGVLDDTRLTITGAQHILTSRENGVAFAEDVDGVTWTHAGAMYRVIVDAPTN